MMKKWIICCLMAVVSLGAVAMPAQQKKEKRAKAQLETVYLLADIDCEGCKAKVLNNVPVLGKGVDAVEVDLPTRTITVTFDPAKTNVQTLVENFKKIKVQVEPTTKPDPSATPAPAHNHAHGHAHNH